MLHLLWMIVQWQCTTSWRKGAEEFNRRYTTIFRINTLFNRTGKVNEKQLPRQREHREVDGQILQSVREIPKTSLRQMSRGVHVRVSKIRTCSKRSFPFKQKIMHTLEKSDGEQRFEYCLFYQGEYLNHDNNFLGNILCNDEVTFTTNGTVSSQISRYLSKPYSGCSVYWRNTKWWKKINLLIYWFLSVQERRKVTFQLDSASPHNVSA